jgi:hypothetical protein
LDDKRNIPRVEVRDYDDVDRAFETAGLSE